MNPNERDVPLEPAARPGESRFRIYGTGQSPTGVHVGSAVCGPFVWHVYEISEVAPNDPTWGDVLKQAQHGTDDCATCGGQGYVNRPDSSNYPKCRDCQGSGIQRPGGLR